MFLPNRLKYFDFLGQPPCMVMRWLAKLDSNLDTLRAFTLGEYESFLKKENFSEGAIIHFSSRIKVSSDIVVGRLQNEEYIDYTELNHLKRKFKLAVRLLLFASY
ncbi:hypothetical protein [Aerococcus viridans]|uniref:hypothetical protein n=1 Tax=Aerococcus viridans TaxID=1377 RepID=UPI001ED96001|nr:hypothetical protein [Aerococcus viridans]